MPYIIFMTHSNYLCACTVFVMVMGWEQKYMFLYLHYLTSRFTFKLHSRNKGPIFFYITHKPSCNKNKASSEILTSYQTLPTYSNTKKKVLKLWKEHETHEMVKDAFLLGRIKELSLVCTTLVENITFSCVQSWYAHNPKESVKGHCICTYDAHMHRTHIVIFILRIFALL